MLLYEIIPLLVPYTTHHNDTIWHDSYTMDWIFQQPVHPPTSLPGSPTHLSSLLTHPLLVPAHWPTSGPFSPTHLSSLLTHLLLVHACPPTSGPFSPTHLSSLLTHLLLVPVHPPTSLPYSSTCLWSLLAHLWSLLSHLWSLLIHPPLFPAYPPHLWFQLTHLPLVLAHPPTSDPCICSQVSLNRLFAHQAFKPTDADLACSIVDLYFVCIRISNNQIKF